MPESSRLGKAFVVVAGAALLYLLITLTAGWSDTRRALSHLPLSLIPILVALSLFNYALRFWRWEIYRRRLRVPLATGESLALFLATFAMVVTPGKVGEVYKAGYLREKHQVPLSTGIPILIAERVLDFLAILALAAAGLAAWQGPLAGLRPSLAIAALILLLLLALRSRRLQARLLTRATRTPRLAACRPALGDALDALQRLSTARVTALAFLLSLLAWTAECLSLWFVCDSLGAPVAPLTAAFVYAVATLAGSLIFLPGGLGGTEGTIIFLLGAAGLATGVAVAAALVVRLATLWLAVAIGVGVFLGRRRQFLERPPTAAAPDAPRLSCD
ncbi:MAG: lysylphosphatidylglycerol synthase transmembrane domain-containing protein [Candidatus Krumholzibacteriia bacterium]